MAKYIFSDKRYIFITRYISEIYSKIYHYGQKDISFLQISEILEIYQRFLRYIPRKIYLSSQFSKKRYIFPRYISKEIYISQRYNSVTQFLVIYLCGTKDISFSRKIISSMLCTSHNFFSNGFLFKFTFKNQSVAKISSERHLNETVPLQNICMRPAFHHILSLSRSTRNDIAEVLGK